MWCVRLPKAAPLGVPYVLIYSLTCAATVLVCELMLALVSASGSPHIWQRRLIKAWSGIRTPTSFGTRKHVNNTRLTLINKPLVSATSSCGSGPTKVKGLRSALSTSDLWNTRVTGPGSRSSNSAFCTGTLQYLYMKHKEQLVFMLSSTSKAAGAALLTSDLRVIQVLSESSGLSSLRSSVIYLQMS